MSIVPISVSFPIPVRHRVEESLHLQAGAVYATGTPAQITTILGSSVAVCLWSPAAAGMAHFILPRGGSERSARYADHAMPMLLEQLRALGTTSLDVVAAVFGGAFGSLGQRNAERAIEMLSRAEIPVIRRDDGGDAARKLTFRTADGSMSVRKIGHEIDGRFAKTRDDSVPASIHKNL